MKFKNQFRTAVLIVLTAFISANSSFATGKGGKDSSSSSLKMGTSAANGEVTNNVLFKSVKEDMNSEIKDFDPNTLTPPTLKNTLNNSPTESFIEKSTNEVTYTVGKKTRYGVTLINIATQAETKLEFEQPFVYLDHFNSASGETYVIGYPEDRFELTVINLNTLKKQHFSFDSKTFYNGHHFTPHSGDAHIILENDRYELTLINLKTGYEKHISNHRNTFAFLTSFIDKNGSTYIVRENHESTLNLLNFETMEERFLKLEKGTVSSNFHIITNLDSSETLVFLTSPKSNLHEESIATYHFTNGNFHKINLGFSEAVITRIVTLRNKKIVAEVLSFANLDFRYLAMDITTGEELNIHSQEELNQQIEP